MTAPDKVTELVERFQRNLDAYKRGQYKEAQVRSEFIDPLFVALGWDVYNTKGYAEAYKDVVHEDSIKVGGGTRAPDYCFRIGGTRKFFLEAKKPSVDIRGDIHPAYQLRRYAWSAKLPLSVLTDFEELAVYDCRVKPVKTDKAATARTLYFTFDEYPHRWDEIAGIFAREAVLQGSFDRYAETAKRKRGTAEVDDAFLAEIESWRETLARNIALRNPGLSQRELNFAVQRTIDRIIFLRICEDRGIEPYGRLRDLADGAGVYERLGRLFRQADDRYNSGLFYFQPEKGRADLPDEMTLDLAIDDKALRPIIGNLYYPDSPYEFSVLPSDILGQVYEQFLGKVIRLTPKHRAVVEEKPEVKKAGGVYYTPTYIVDYIVEQTVGRMVEGKSQRQVARLRVLDPACGSGSFLLGAYQYLLDWHRDWYVADDPERWARSRPARLYQGPTGDWRLTAAERKRVLLNNIYGVDIDSQAVEVTKLSLLLKVLEDEYQGDEATQLGFFQERALPDLADNVKCGNSLIGPDFYSGRQLVLLDDEERYRVNVFDWEAEFPEIMDGGGFDVVIGNPPYGMIAEEKLKSYLGSRLETPEGRFDIYELFIEQGINLCRIQGTLGYIVPSPLLSNLYTRKLRQHILDNCAIQEITNFGMDVFTDPTIHTCIIIIERGKADGQNVRIRKQVMAKQQLQANYDYTVPQAALGNNDRSTFDIFVDPTARRIIEKLLFNARPLGNICHIRQCIKTGNNEKYVKSSNVVLEAPWKPTLSGRSIRRYATVERNLYVKYGPWLARNWKNKSFYETPKIVVRETGKRITATLDLEHRYVLSTLYSVYPESTNDSLSLSYLLGIINSELATYFMRIIALDLTKGAFTKVRTNQLARLPIRTIDFSDPADVARHDQMVELVEAMLSLHQRLAEAKTAYDKRGIQRQIDATDRQIDRLVYELYELTEEEIGIVEEATE